MRRLFACVFFAVCILPLAVFSKPEMLKPKGICYTSDMLADMLYLIEGRHADKNTEMLMLVKLNRVYWRGRIQAWLIVSESESYYVDVYLSERSYKSLEAILPYAFTKEAALKMDERTQEIADILVEYVNNIQSLKKRGSVETMVGIKREVTLSQPRNTNFLEFSKFYSRVEATGAQPKDR